MDIHREYAKRGVNQFNKVATKQKLDLDSSIDYLYKEAETD